MLPLVVAGLPVGAMYGLAALGLIVVHRATRNIDLSLGAVATAAAFVYHRLSADVSLPAPLAALAALGVAAALGLAAAAVGRLLGPGRPLAGAVASLALAGLVLAGCAALFGTDTEFVSPLFPGVQLEVAGTVLSGHQVLVLATALAVVVAGGVLLRRSITGLAWNAVAADRVGACVVGLPVRRIETLSSVIAAVLAGGAGILLAPLLFLDPVQLTVFFLVKPFAAAVAARLHSLPVALAAGLSIGVLESLSVRVQDVPGLGETVPFVVMAILLLRRERGAREEATAALDRGPSRIPGRGRIWPAAALWLGLVIWAPHQSPYQATITQLAATTALLAATHVVMTGWTGQLSLAQPVFAGIGAIVAARLGAEAGWSLPLTLLAGALGAASAAALVGGLTLARGTSGIRFAAVTLALSSACAGTLFLWAPFAGRAEDRSLDAPSLGSLSLAGPRFTWVVMTAAAVAFWALRALARSRWGAAMLATREHALAAVALGMSPAAARCAAFTVTGAIAGLAGALSAHQLQSVSVDGFHPLTALPLLSVAAVGGIESLWGAAVGAVFLTLAPEALRQWDIPTVAAFVAPAALLGTILIRPGGLTSAAAGHTAGRRRSGAAKATQEVDITEQAGPLIVDRFRVSYGRFLAVDDVALSVAPGELVALIGPNGAGKTTVLDAISGFVRPTGGRLVLAGADLAGRPARARAGAGVVRTFQSGGLFPRLSLWENFDVVRRWHRLPPVDDKLIAATGLAPYLDRPAAALPHGTARIGEITRAMSLSPKVLLLDEPAAGLTRKESEAMIAMLRSTAGGAAVLVVEHDQHVVGLADRAVVLHLGKVLAAGPPAEALRHPDVVDAYLGQLPAPV